MERNEEIKQALSRYVKNRGVSGNHIVDVERDAAFIAGALWADNNPDLSSLWHDANIVPSENKGIIYLTKNNKLGVFNSIKSNKWDWYVSGKYSIIKWAYISDLLPKGGEK